MGPMVATNNQFAAKSFSPAMPTFENFIFIATEWTTGYVRYIYFATD